jgi:hypothetical protein
MHYDRDLEHLKLLAVFHYILAGIAGLFACIPLIHMGMGAFFITVASRAGPGGPPPAVGWVFVVMGTTFMLVGWTAVGLLIAAGRFLARRQRYTFCFAIACLSCLWIPMGTVLGVFSIIVLARPRVKYLFEVAAGTVRPPTLAPAAGPTGRP